MKYLLIIISLLTTSTALFSQDDASYTLQGKSIFELKQKADFLAIKTSFSPRIKMQIPAQEPSKSILLIPRSNHCQVAGYQSNGHTAFFCKMEDKLDRKKGIPFKFRLGSVDYVDALEGK